MGLLDGGMRAVFGAAFGAIYLNGTLHVITLIDDGKGGFTRSTPADLPIKYQRDEMSDFYRASNGIPATQVRVLILQAGLAVKPTKEHKFTIAEGSFSVVDVDQDPAGTYWRVRGEPAGAVAEAGSGS